MWIRQGANKDLNYHPLVSAVSRPRLRRCKLPGLKWLPAGEVKARPKDHGLKDGDQRTESLSGEERVALDSVLCCVKWLCGRVKSQ